MAKKKEVNRCPLSDSCDRKCEFKNLEFKCDYFMNNMTFELEAECREKGIYLPELSQEFIDWDSVSDDDNVDSGFINDKLSDYQNREYCVDGYSLLEGKLYIAHEDSEVVS